MESAALEAARRSGLVAPGEPLLVMLSGGADSCCLLDVAVRLGASARALHVNYGLRGAESEADEAHCRALCERLGVPLAVERVALGGERAAGNLQARARDARYALAERLAPGDYAAAHTRSDQAETVLYRLATSPGRRTLHGMAARRGRLVRPLLDASGADTRAHCVAAGIEWREDASNADGRFARARIRHEALPALGDRAEAAIAETARQLREESEVLDAAVDAAATDELAALAAMPPALARLVLARLAGTTIARERCEEILALAGRGGTVSLDAGRGLRAVVEYGHVRFTRAREPVTEAPDPVELPIPGRARFGDCELQAGPEAALAPSGPLAHFDAHALGDAVTVRSWRPGDRIRPAGLGGTKTLQNLFTDRKVPRVRRRATPVVEAGGSIAWVPGLAVAEEFRAREGARSVALAVRLAPR